MYASLRGVGSRRPYLLPLEFIFLLTSLKTFPVNKFYSCFLLLYQKQQNKFTLKLRLSMVNFNPLR